jgi:EAL domain-containing protein (putative c-di-GMP-specific phosphodiesterase class I)
MAADFADTVAGVLGDTGTDPTLVTLEVTENVFIQDSERALMVLNDLKRLGVMLALDDFGTGFSSLSYLDRFPVDVVKVDRSFIANLDREPTSRLILNAIVGLAHALGMTVIAEGVETTAQHDMVTELEADFYQGFYYGSPSPADVIDTLIIDSHRANRPVPRSVVNS